ncbi:MAG: hypothetical protein COA86_02395 [Kangiella sp.]|nr:MAG: hypothetical protein COA86_02395 [Kangiella sp.]
MKVDLIKLKNLKGFIEKLFSIVLIIILSVNLSLADVKHNSNISGINVANVYPTSEKIPENILRFYIYFDAPMREGNIFDFIKLFDEHNNEMSHVFFDSVHELWTPDHKRLTLLLDPGRVKSGLQANSAMGRAFTANKKYKLIVSEGFEAISGLKTTADYVKVFTATSEDREGINISRWQIEFPKHDLDKLKIDFKEPVDHVSAQHFILIVDHSGKEIEGSIDLQPNETGLVFEPTLPWVKGQYRILINHRFEDIVANNINGAFDHKVGSLMSLNEGEVSSIEFHIPTE